MRLIEGELEQFYRANIEQNDRKKGLNKCQGKLQFASHVVANICSGTEQVPRRE